MPTAAQLYRSNNPSLVGSEIIPAQNSLLVGGCTTAQIANCVDQFYATRTFMPRAANNNTGTDVSGNALALTRTSMTTSNVSTQDPYAWVFNGTTSYFNVASPVNATVFATGDLTFEAWILVNSFVSTNGIFDCRAAAASSPTGVYVSLAPTTGYLGITSNNITTSAAVAPTLGTYTHIAVVRQGGYFSGYQNGVQVIAPYSYPGTLTDGTLSIGASYAAANIFGSGAAASMSGIRISKAALYTEPFAPPTTPFPAIA